MATPDNGPTLEAPTDAVRNAAVAWYLNNEEEYDTIWPRLDEMRQVFDTADRDVQIGLLKGSYVFTVYTQLTKTHVAEESFRSLINSASILESRRIKIGNDVPGKENQMTAWIMDSFARTGVWESVANLVGLGDADGAQNLMMDDLKGLKAAKSGFVLANIGVTQKMCTDSNVLGLVGGSKSEVGKMGAKQYNDYCFDIRSFFPRLQQMEDLEPYHLQWILFDFARLHNVNNDNIRLSSDAPRPPRPATHDVWFGIAIPNPGRIASKMRSLTERALAVRTVINSDPDYLDGDGDPKYRDLTQLMHHANEGADEVPVVMEKAEGVLAGNGPEPEPESVTQQIEDALGEMEAASIGERLEDDIEAAIGGDD